MNTPIDTPSRAVVEAAWERCPWGTAMIAGDGRVCAVSAGFEAVAGIAAAQVLGIGEAAFYALLATAQHEARRVEIRSGELRAAYFLCPAAPRVGRDPGMTAFVEALREPLASIFGFAELLLTQNYDEETRRNLTATLLEQVEAMANAVNGQ